MNFIIGFIFGGLVIGMFVNGYETSKVKELSQQYAVNEEMLGNQCTSKISELRDKYQPVLDLQNDKQNHALSQCVTKLQSLVDRCDMKR